MEPAHRTLDMAEELAALNDSVAQIEDRIEERVEEAEDLDDVPREAWTEDDAARWQSLNAEVTQLEDTLTRIRGYTNILERAIDEYDGTEFTVRELTGQESRIVKAEAQTRMERLDLEPEHADDITEIEFLKRAIESTPAGAPSPEEIHGVPNNLFDWLLRNANNLNSVGEFDMGNSSLRERMADRSPSSNSA